MSPMAPARQIRVTNAALLLSTFALLTSCVSEKSGPIGRMSHAEVWRVTGPDIELQSPTEGGIGGLIAMMRTATGIAVAEAADQQIRFYSDQHILLKDGFPSPEKNRRLLWAGRCTGTGLIATQDFGSQRFTFFNDSGVVLRSVAIPRELAFAQLIACPADGSLLMLHTLPARFVAQGTSTPEAQLVRIDSAGHTDVVRTFAGTEYFYSKRDKIFVEQPLGRLAMATAYGNTVFAGNSGQRGLEMVGPTGALKGHITLGITSRTAVASDLLEAVTLRIYREPSETTRERLRRVIVQTPLRSAELLYDALKSDAEGNLWLRTFEIPRRDTVRWAIVNTDGDVIAHCDLPADMFVGEIGADYVAGIRRRIGEVDRAAVFHLVKSGVGPS